MMRPKDCQTVLFHLAVALSVAAVETNSARAGDFDRPLQPVTSGSLFQGITSSQPTVALPGFVELQDLIIQQQHQLLRQAARIDQLERHLPSQRASTKLGEVRQSPIRPTEHAALHDGDLAGRAYAPSPDFVESQQHSYDCQHCDPMFSLGGQYRLMFNASNFGYHPATINDDQQSQSFFNQRFRTWLSVQTSENVEGYIQVEMGHILWGDDREFPKAFTGPRFPPSGDDRVGIELRRGYLTYNNDDIGTFRVGIQDWHDAFGESPTLGTVQAVDDYDSMAAVLANSVWDFNVGGLSYTGKVSALADMSLNAGAFVLWEGNVQDIDDAWLFALDGDWTGHEDHSIGFSVYFLPDFDNYSFPTAAPYDWAWDLWIGVRGRLALDPAPLNGFVLYNTGRRNELAGPDFDHDAIALKLEVGPIPLGRGGLRIQTLYSTEQFRTIAQSERDNFGAQGYWSYLALTSPNPSNDVNDLGVSLQNRGLGLFTAQVAFDYDIHESLSATFAVGWLNSDQPNPVSGSRDMGTELLKMFTVDFGGGLKADIGAAVLFTGDFYKPAPNAAGPNTLWEAFSRVQLEF